MDRDSVSSMRRKSRRRSALTGSWVLRTTTDLSAEQVALQVQDLAGGAGSSDHEVHPRHPAQSHQRDETIRATSSQLSCLVLIKELYGD